jgi:hypothetical protein
VRFSSISSFFLFFLVVVVVVVHYSAMIPPIDTAYFSRYMNAYAFLYFNDSTFHANASNV